MITCEVCGGVEFEKYAGFMYCACCQTQSQEYHEQEYEYQATDSIRKQKGKKRAGSKSKDREDEGTWTTWEAFNYILYGMTQELKNICLLPYEFQFLVLKLWAAYLKACDAGFVSLSAEALPKLQYTFKHRDARILFNLDMDKYKLKKKKKTKSICSSVTNVSSGTSVTESRRSLGQRRSRIIASDYQELISASGSNIDIKYETLETLGRSNVEEMIIDKEDDAGSDLVLKKCLKKLLVPKDYKIYEKVMNSKKTKFLAKEQAKRSIKYLAKNKLLSILHLALIMTDSEAQLSDLLRWIRESHLSYAKVTQFLPKDMKFGRNDLTYIDVINDQMMPTHLCQRKLTSQLASLVGIDKLEVPNMSKLVRRYCYDLNLPSEIGTLCEKIMANWLPKYTTPMSTSHLPDYEAWAMASIIFVLKLLFGVNDRTELFLSDLAKHLNKITNSSDEKNSKNLFVFEDWQKFIECRKAVLMEFHYPTQEQLDADCMKSSKRFLDVLARESKDEFRAQRFIPYGKYFEDSGLMDSVRHMVGRLTEPVILDFIEFEPSLTPQTSCLETILNSTTLKMEKGQTSNGTEFIPETLREYLKQSFRDCSINFAFKPGEHLANLNGSGEDSSRNFRFYKESCGETPSCDKLLTKCFTKYWTLHYSDSDSSKLMNFKGKILDKTPENFQWLITECSRMLEMNVRDVYSELMNLEETLMYDIKLRDAALFF